VRFLHAMTTNHVERLKPGDGCYSFFLNAQGRILGDVNLLCFEDHFLLDTEPETRRKLFEHLDRYIIADDVTLEDATDGIATIAVEGPESAAVLKKMGDGALPEAPYSTVSWSNQAGQATIARLSSTGADGYFLFVPAERKDEVIAQLSAAGAIAATREDARIVRIETGARATAKRSPSATWFRKPANYKRSIFRRLLSGTGNRRAGAQPGSDSSRVAKSWRSIPPSLQRLARSSNRAMPMRAKSSVRCSRPRCRKLWRWPTCACPSLSRGRRFQSKAPSLASRANSPSGLCSRNRSPE